MSPANPVQTEELSIVFGCWNSTASALEMADILADWRVIEEGYYKDVLIFAAAHNDHPFTRSYPAMFAPPLISVDKQLFDDPMAFAYLQNEQIEFQAHSRGYLGPFA